ncbi:JmjC domain-containing protein [Streptacidiphilus sp. PAMC 29251]
MIVTDGKVESVLGIPGSDLSEAMGLTFLHRPGALPTGDQFSWSDLNRALQYGNLRTDQVRVVGGEAPADGLFRAAQAGGSRAFHRLVPEAVHRALASGGTLVVDQLDLIDPWADGVARALAGVFRARVQANLYASLHGAPGFGVHRDSHDVFVVQGRGRKHWTVGEGADAAQVAMNPGDVLYLPEGTPHDVATDVRGSLHITFAIPRPNVQELLAWVVTGSQDDRLKCAVDGNDPALTATALARQTSALTGVGVASFVEEKLGSSMAPTFMNLPHTTSGGPTRDGIAGLYVRRSFVDVLPEDARTHAEVLDSLSATRSVAVDDLLRADDTGRVLGAIQELAVSGLITLTDA